MSVLRMTAVALWLASAVSTSRAQECAPGEVAPATATKPECSTFERISGRCAKKNEAYEDATRLFATPYRLETDSSTATDQIETSFQITGCAGAIIAPIVSGENLTRVELHVFSPSGADLFANGGRVVGTALEYPPVDLPQSGHYKAKLVSTARYAARTTCAKFKGTTCAQPQRTAAYPRVVEIKWHGSAGNRALESGDEWRPVLERNQPTSRRLRLDAGAGATVRIEAAARMPVDVRTTIARGGLLSEQRLPTGVGTVRIAPKGDEQTVILRIAPDARNTAVVPLVVKIDTLANVAAGTDAAAPTSNAGAVEGAAERTIAVGTSASGRIALGGEGVPGDRWSFSGTKGESLMLDVIPSGKAGLTLSVEVSSVATEEVVGARRGIAARFELPIKLLTSGKYTIEVRAESIRTPDADGRALYTLELSRRPAR